jgi:hypothetical protein
MAEIGSFNTSPIIPRERIGPPQRMQPRDGEKPARGTPVAANRPQNPSNSVSAATSLVPASISQACRGMRLDLDNKSGMRYKGGVWARIAQCFFSGSPQ